MSPTRCTEKEFVINNLLVRIHFIIVMIRWTGLAPWKFEFQASSHESDTLRRDWYLIAEPAPAPHLAHPEGCAALRIVLVTVPRVYRSCEHFPDARPAPSAAAPGNENINIPEKSGGSPSGDDDRVRQLGAAQD